MPLSNPPDPNLANIGKEKFKDKLDRVRQNQEAQEAATPQQNKPNGIAKLLQFLKNTFSRRA